MRKETKKKWTHTGIIIEMGRQKEATSKTQHEAFPNWTFFGASQKNNLKDTTFII